MVTCILKNTIIFKGFKMGTTFSRGAPTIPGWVQMLIAIENHIACDFPGGSRPSIPPLWIRAWLTMCESRVLSGGPG